MFWLSCEVLYNLEQKPWINTWNKGVTLATWLRAFYAPLPYNAVPSLLFLSPSFCMAPSLSSIPVRLYVPHPSLTFSASPPVPVCRYTPSPLAAFCCTRGHRGEKKVWRNEQETRTTETKNLVHVPAHTHTWGQRKLQGLEGIGLENTRQNREQYNTIALQIGSVAALSLSGIVLCMCNFILHVCVCVHCFKKTWGICGPAAGWGCKSRNKWFKWVAF